MRLQDIVGERVPENDSPDLFDVTYGQSPEAPIAPAGMDAFADRANLVLGLAVVTRHSGAPGLQAWTVAATRQERIDAAPGSGRRTIDLDALAMRPLDILSTAEPAIDEVTAGKALQPVSHAFEHGPHQAAV